MKTTNKLGAGLAVLACVATVAGCGGSSGTSGEASGSETAIETRDDALVALAQCMRDRGIDVPDPSPGKALDLDGLDEPQDMIDAAMEECQESVGGTSDASPEELDTRQDALVEFASCMREHGVDMPDPDFSGASGSGASLLDQVRDDPDFDEAIQACAGDPQSTPSGEDG